MNQLLKKSTQPDPRIVAGLCFLVAVYAHLLYAIFTRQSIHIAISLILLAVDLVMLRWVRNRHPVSLGRPARRYITPVFIFMLFGTLLFLTPSSFAQGNGTPVIICEYCYADEPVGTTSGQPPTGSPTGTTGTATGTNAAGQTVQFPVGTFPSNQLSTLSPISPANAAKIGVPSGWTIVGQSPQGNPVLERPDGSYAVIYTSSLNQTGLMSNALQSATPSPSPIPWEAGLPSAQIQKLMDMVRELVPYIRRQVEAPLLQKFSYLAMILSSIVILFSFIRVIRENDGASGELYYWFARAVICMALFALAPTIISYLYKVGRTLTIPIEPLIEEKRTAFNDQYYAFVQGHFIIKDEKNVYIQPAYIEPGQDGWVGILTDHESGDGKLNGLKAIESATDLTSWPMPKLFFGLNVARGILQAGEIFLLVLSGFVMIGLRLASPWIVAVAVDKKLSERIAYPFLWGTVVFTMIFPVVRDSLIFIAYTVGSFGLSLYDGTAPYAIDDRTAQIIKTNAYDPTLVIIITLCIMLINGLLLWAAPYLAYRIATGQVFEAVSSTASGWMAAIIGSAIEFTGLKTGASLQRQAENTQTQEGYKAELTRAKGALDASNLGANARQISAHANIEGNRQATLSAIAGGAQTARQMATTNANFTIASTRAQVGDSARQMMARAEQSVDQTRYSQAAESQRIAGESSASHIQNKGSAFSGIPYGGPAVSSVFNDVGITRRNRSLNLANNSLADNTVRNELSTAGTILKSQGTYMSDMETATNQQLAGNIDAVNSGAAIAAGGANRGAAISNAGVDRAYSIELQANQAQFTSTTTAAGQIKEGNLEAARLRELSSIITGVARDMDRRIEEGMRQRY